MLVFGNNFCKGNNIQITDVSSTFYRIFGGLKNLKDLDNIFY